MRSLSTPITILVILIAIPAGTGAYTFYYADGVSYLHDDPAACANCHVMREMFDDWSKGSHAHVATCNDCHVPNSFIGKWYTKAENGFSHSLAMTLGHVPVNIRARESSKQIALDNCITCHGTFVDSTAHYLQYQQEPADCTRCHRDVGHPH